MIALKKILCIIKNILIGGRIPIKNKIKFTIGVVIFISHTLTKKYILTLCRYGDSIGG